MGQTVVFSTDAAVHFRTSTLLGKSAEVRFTPLSTTWTLAGNASEVGSTLAHRFEMSGSFVISARVLFRVDYRVAGAADWVPGGEIAVSDSASVSVSSVNVVVKAPVAKPRVLLVAKNCLERPAKFGCLP